MRRSLFFLILCGIVISMVCFNTGCTQKKPEAVDTLVVADTMAVDTVETDTLAQIVEATPMPKAADELFDDFFFNFINSKKLQRARVKFPLPVRENGANSVVQRGQWQMEKFFRDQEYYTLIFDNEKQMKVVKDTSIAHVTVEKIFLQQGNVEQFVFNRENGQWMLTEKNTVGLGESKNASFLKFLQGFFAQPTANNVKDPLPYYGPDPENEDDSKYVNIHIPADTWSDYVPEIPGNMVYNILYGQEYGEGNEKIFLFKGLSNGLQTQLRFKKSGDEWTLVKLDL